VHRRAVDDMPPGSIGDLRIRHEDRHSVHAAVVAAQFQMMPTCRDIRDDEIEDLHTLVVDIQRADLDRIGEQRSDELAHLRHLSHGPADCDETGPQMRTGLHDNLIGTEPAMRACHCTVPQRGEQHLTTAVGAVLPGVAHCRALHRQGRVQGVGHGLRSAFRRDRFVNG
jgi:hypothetical protein